LINSTDFLRVPSASCFCLQRVSIFRSSWRLSLGSKVSARYLIYNYYLHGLETGLNHFLTVDRRPCAGKDRPILQIEHVGFEWTSILGVNSEIRREVSCLFWRLNTFRLRPGSAESLNRLARENIRKVFLEVVSPRARASNYTLSMLKIEKAFPGLLRLPSLERLEVCVDAQSLKACIPIEGDGLCEKHAELIRSSKALRQLGQDLKENWAGYLYFRLHLTDDARSQTYEQVVHSFPSLSKVGNNSLNPCSDHELGSCGKISCRLLHAVEEMSQDKRSSPSTRLYFCEENISTWTSDTTTVLGH